MRCFPLRVAGWAKIFLYPLAVRGGFAEVDADAVRVRLGWLGRADVPIDRVAGVGTMRWPWWGGAGARIGRGMVAFMGASGPASVIELTEPIEVRAPLRWRAARLVVGVADVPGFNAAVAAARRGD